MAKEKQFAEFATTSGKKYDPMAAKWRQGEAGLAPFVKEFTTGKMPMRTLVALRERLVSLYKSQQITEAEHEFMETVLRFFRKRGAISTTDNYLLSELEAAKCEDVCWVAHDDTPTVLGLKKDAECRFKADPVNDRVEVYFSKIIPPMSQLSHAQAVQAANNQPIADLPKERVLTKRLDLKRVEFLNWFRVADETILAQPEPTPAVATF